MRQAALCITGRNLFSNLPALSRFEDTRFLIEKCALPF
jgi:hypothetical protein